MDTKDRSLDKFIIDPTASEPKLPENLKLSGAMGRTESGLIVPTTLARKREAWLEDDWKPLRRMTRVAQDRKINVILQCQECGKLIEFSHNPDNGQVAMECECKRRELI